MNWTCPHCQNPQIASAENQQSDTIYLGIVENGHEGCGFEYTALRCLNNQCGEITFGISLGDWVSGDILGMQSGGLGELRLWQGSIYPFGTAKPQPDYIPPVIAEDYYEACKIKELSPKAAATLARRCLQGMIRDFAGISKGRLIDEIKALNAAIKDGSADRSISEESVAAIDAVRSIGNIGAHMEKDVNHIIAVDAGEVTVLLELIEQLFEDWYGARDSRQKRRARVTKIASDKKSAKPSAAKADQ
jgi:hypothetical protein